MENSSTENHSHAGKINFLEGFAWAVPYAFVDALAACQFEEGDTFYNTESAYTPQKTSANLIDYCIQVTFPARKRGAGKTGGSIFKKGWSSTVEFELIDYKKGERKKTLSSTQGKLFSLLWKGNLTIIDSNAPPPPVPLVLSDVKKRVKELRAVIDKVRGENPAFVIAHDETNAITRQKKETILNVLIETFGFENVKPHTTLALETMWNDKEEILPTIRFQSFIISSKNIEKIELALQNALYNPSEQKKFDRDSFRLSSHGFLFFNQSF